MRVWLYLGLYGASRHCNGQRAANTLAWYHSVTSFVRYLLFVYLRRFTRLCCDITLPAALYRARCYISSRIRLDDKRI